jgi:hypothetical protein
VPFACLTIGAGLLRQATGNAKGLKRPVRWDTADRMKKVTEDHGEIIHFAGRHHLFPVAKKEDRQSVRLASRNDVAPDEVRIGWDSFFRAFIDRGLVFLFDETSGQVATREQAAAALASEPAEAAGAAATQA